MKAKYKKYVKWGAVALGSVLIVGATAAITTAVVRDKEVSTRTLNATDYARYVLDDVTGLADTEDHSNISTGAFFVIDGLKCELAKDAEITYQLNFYDEDKKFLSMESYDDDFDGSEIESLKAQGVEYVRIEILPIGDADGTVSVFEKIGYVKQLKVTVEKNAEKEAEDVEDSEA